jgi:hypothetical protein
VCERLYSIPLALEFVQFGLNYTYRVYRLVMPKREEFSETKVVGSIL